MSTFDSAPLADIQLELVDDVLVVTVIGQLDLSNHVELAELVLPHVDDVRDVVLDLSQTSFIDMPTAGIIARIRNDLRRHGGALHVVPSRRVLHSLEMCGLAGVVHLHDDTASARHAVGGPAPDPV